MSVEKIKLIKNCRASLNTIFKKGSNITLIKEKPVQLQELPSNTEFLRNYYGIKKYHPSPASPVMLSNNYLKSIQEKMHIPEFSDKVPLKKINSLVENGSVCVIKGQLHVNNQGNFIPLKMSKKMFEKLFPQDKLFLFEQGKNGNCWIASSLAGLLDKPKGRTLLYQMFEQQGNDIVVKLNGRKTISDIKLFFDMTLNLLKKEGIKEKDFVTRKFVFKDAKALESSKNLKAVEGLKMIEQAFATARAGNCGNIVDMSKNINIDNILSKIGEGSTVREFFMTIFKCFENKQGELIDTQGIKRGENTFSLKKAHELLQKYANNNDTMVFAETQKSPIKETFYNGAVALDENHCYTIKGYDAKKQTVYISNPHCDRNVTELPLDKLKKYFLSLLWVSI